MDTKSFTQKDVDRVWGSVWQTSHRIDARSAFYNRLFIEGHRVMQPWIPKEVRSILDVGTGTGAHALAFARDFPSAQVVASDILEASLSIVRALQREIGLKNLSVERQDGHALSYNDDSFDVVFSDAVLQHVPDDRAMIAEMARVTRPRGLVIISSVNALSPHAFVRFLQKIFGKQYSYGVERMYTRGMFEAYAAQAGLELVAIEGFFPAYGIYRLKRYWRGFGLLGRMLNRITRFFDGQTNNWVSNHFGFELVLVARKPNK